MSSNSSRSSSSKKEEEERGSEQLLRQLLHQLYSCTSLACQRGSAFSKHTTDGGETQHARESAWCALWQLLCFWIAARVALPEHVQSDAQLLLRSMATQHLRRPHKASSACAITTTNSQKKSSCKDTCGEDDERNDLESLYCRSAVRNTFTVDYLLPDCNGSSCTSLPQNDNHENNCDACTTSFNAGQSVDNASLQCNIERLFQQLLFDGSQATAAATLPERPSLHQHRRATSLYKLWKVLEKSSEHLLFHPADFSNDDVVLLLYVFAHSATERAACALLDTTPLSSQRPPAHLQLRRVAFAFRRLLDAQQAARNGARFFDSSLCRDLLETRIQCLLQALTLGFHPCGAEPSFLHAAVELTGDSLFSVAGRGLVATGDLAEGEQLLRERSLLTLPGPWQPPNTKQTEEEVTERIVDCVATHSPSQGEPAESKQSASFMYHERGGASQKSAESSRSLTYADCVLYYFETHPEASSDTWWYPWAVILSDTDVPRDDHHDSVETCIEGFVHAAQGASVDGSGTALPFMSVREVDELHLPRPPVVAAAAAAAAAAALHSASLSQSSPRGRFLLPPLDSTAVATDALFCLLRFVNHGCSPNALLVYDTRADADAGRLGGALVGTLVALRDIDAGEEITISYVAATTALTVSRDDLTHLLRFACRCPLCTHKAALLHGVLCSECGQLVLEASPEKDGKGPSSRAGTCASQGPSAFCHASHCSRRATQQTSPAGRGGEESIAVDSVAQQLRRQLDRIAARVVEENEKQNDDSSSISHCVDAEGGCACQRSTTTAPPTALATAVRQLLDLDERVSHALLPTHHLRLRLRLEAVAYSAAAPDLGSAVSARLIHLCAATLQELEVLLSPNHPLLTGLRMYLVFSRGRHVRAVTAAEALKAGTRHSECCGAVREQAALMALPFVVDPLVRQCVARCFQEHFAQLLGWRLPRLTPSVTEEDVLRSFLRRYPVELEAAGVTTTEHMELLSCMEEGVDSGTP